MVDTTRTPKSPLASKTIWGGIVAIAGALAPIVLPALGIPASEIASLSGAVATVAGALVAIYGRFTAKRPLG